MRFGIVHPGAMGTSLGAALVVADANQGLPREREGERLGAGQGAGAHGRSARRLRVSEERVRPGGDSLASPSESYGYLLGNPVSQVFVRKRSQVGGPLDIETIRCGCAHFAGRGAGRRLVRDAGIRGE